MSNSYLLDKDFLRQIDLQHHKEKFAKITALTWDEKPIVTIEGQLTAGSINVDGTSAVRRTCNLTITTQDVNINEFYWGIRTKFTVEIGLKNYVNSIYPDTVWFPMGQFVITTFNTNYSTNSCQITISGKDKMCLLNGDLNGQIFASVDFKTQQVDFTQYNLIDISNKNMYKTHTFYLKYKITGVYNSKTEERNEYILATGEYLTYPENPINYMPKNKVKYYNQRYGENQWSITRDFSEYKYEKYDPTDYSIKMYLTKAYPEVFKEDFDLLCEKRDKKIEVNGITPLVSTKRLAELLNMEFKKYTTNTSEVLVEENGEIVHKEIKNGVSLELIPLKDVDWEKELWLRTNGQSSEISAMGQISSNYIISLPELRYMRDLAMIGLIFYTRQTGIYDGLDFSIRMYLTKAYPDDFQYNFDTMAELRDWKIIHDPKASVNSTVTTERLKQILLADYGVPLYAVDWNTVLTNQIEINYMKYMAKVGKSIHEENPIEAEYTIFTNSREGRISTLYEEAIARYGDTDYGKSRAERAVNEFLSSCNYTERGYSLTELLNHYMNTPQAITTVASADEIMALSKKIKNGELYYYNSLYSPYKDEASSIDTIYDESVMTKVELDGLTFLEAQDQGLIPKDIYAFYVKNKNKNIYYTDAPFSKLIDLPLKVIIREAVHAYGLEPYHNIIIDDLDDYGLNLMQYKGNNPLYIFRDFETDQFTQIADRGDIEVYYSNPIFSVDNPNTVIGWEEWSKYPVPISVFADIANSDYFKCDPRTGNFADIESQVTKVKFAATPTGQTAKEYSIAVVRYGESFGYSLTDLTYAGTLISNIGDTITSVLDKIKDMLGDFEYFYDIDGRFIFQRKKTFVNTSWNNIIDGTDEMYVQPAAISSPVIYSFDENQLVTAINNTPQLNNVKNDYSIWGNRKTLDGTDIPIHMRYAIDTKPVYYKAINGKIYTTNLSYVQDTIDEAKKNITEAYQLKILSFQPQYSSLIPYQLNRAQQRADGSWSPGWWEIRDWARFYELLTGETPTLSMPVYSSNDENGFVDKSLITGKEGDKGFQVWLFHIEGNDYYDFQHNSYSRYSDNVTRSLEIKESYFDDNGILRVNSTGEYKEIHAPYNGCTVHTYLHFLDGIKNEGWKGAFFYNPNFPEASFEELVNTTITEEVSEWLKSGEVNVVDWREIIYQMAKDYQDYEGKDNFLSMIRENNPLYYPSGYTGYEQYYTDMLGFWRQLYNPDAEPEIEYEAGHFETEQIDIGLNKFIQYDYTDYSAELFKSYHNDNNNLVEHQQIMASRDYKIDLYSLTPDIYIMSTNRLYELIRGTWEIDGEVQNSLQVDWSMEIFNAYVYKNNNTGTTIDEAKLMRNLKICYRVESLPDVEREAGHVDYGIETIEIDNYFKTHNIEDATWEKVKAYALRNENKDYTPDNGIAVMAELIKKGKLYYLKDWNVEGHERPSTLYMKDVGTKLNYPPSSQYFANEMIDWENEESTIFPPPSRNLFLSDWYIKVPNLMFKNFSPVNVEDVNNFAYKSFGTVSTPTTTKSTYYVQYDPIDWSVYMYWAWMREKDNTPGNNCSYTFEKCCEKRNAKIKELLLTRDEYILTTDEIIEIFEKVKASGNTLSDFDWSEEVKKINQGMSSIGITANDAKCMRNMKIDARILIGDPIEGVYNGDYLDSWLNSSNSEKDFYEWCAAQGLEQQATTNFSLNIFNSLSNLRKKNRLYYYKDFTKSPNNLAHIYQQSKNLNILENSSSKNLKTSSNKTDLKSLIEENLLPNLSANQLKYYYIKVEEDITTYDSSTVVNSTSASVYYLIPENPESEILPVIDNKLLLTSLTSSLTSEQFADLKKQQARWYYAGDSVIYKKFDVNSWSDIENKYKSNIHLFYIKINDIDDLVYPAYYYTVNSKMHRVDSKELEELSFLWNSPVVEDDTNILHTAANNQDMIKAYGWYMETNDVDYLTSYEEKWVKPKIKSLTLNYYITGELEYEEAQLPFGSKLNIYTNYYYKDNNGNYLIFNPPADNNYEIVNNKIVIDGVSQSLYICIGNELLKTENWTENNLNYTTDLAQYKSLIVLYGDARCYWHKDVFNSPQNLNFWIDFLDGGELARFNAKRIGPRAKVVNDTSVSAIYFQEVPNIIVTTEEILSGSDFYPQNTETNEETRIKNQEIFKGKIDLQRLVYKDFSGYSICTMPQIRMDNLFSISYQGKTAKNALDDLLYQFSYATENITITSLPIYYLEPNNRIFVKDAERKINGEYIITKITYPLAYNGTMQITATKAPIRIY